MKRKIPSAYKMDMESRGISVISADEILGMGHGTDGEYVDRLDGKFLTRGMSYEELDALLEEFPNDVKSYTIMMEEKLKSYFSKHKISHRAVSDEVPAGYEKLYMSAIEKGIEPEFYGIKIIGGGELTRFVPISTVCYAMKTVEPVRNIVRYKGTLLERYDEGMVVPYGDVMCPFRDGEYIQMVQKNSIDDVMEHIFLTGVNSAGLETMRKKRFAQRIRMRLGIPWYAPKISVLAKKILGITGVDLQVDDPDDSSWEKLYGDQRVGRVDYKDGLEFKYSKSQSYVKKPVSENSPRGGTETTHTGQHLFSSK